jgi:hypothetical protein
MDKNKHKQFKIILYIYIAERKLRTQLSVLYTTLQKKSKSYMLFFLTCVYFWLDVLPWKLNNSQSIFEFRAHVCLHDDVLDCT